MLHLLLGSLAVAGAFGFLIIVHEFGHFLAAKRFGVRCPSFGIGIGPQLWCKRWRGTDFEIRPFPFIGYVMMTGEDSSPDSQEWRSAVHYFLTDMSFPTRPAALLAELEANRDRLLEGADEGRRHRFAELQEHLRFHPDVELKSPEDAEGNFNAKTAFQRIVILLGGITMNMISSILLFVAVGLCFGIGGFNQDLTTSIKKVNADTAAQRAGLTAGQVILAVGGQEVRSGLEMIQAISRYPGKTVDLQVADTPKGQPHTVRLTPDAKLGPMTFTQKGDQVAYLYPYNKDLAPADLKVGSVVATANGQSVHSLSELVGVGEKALDGVGVGQKAHLELTFVGVAKPVSLQGSAEEMRPVGKIGIQPSSIAEIHFARKAINLVQSVAPGSPAASAGLLPDDEIDSLNGVEISSYETLQAELSRLAQARPPYPLEVYRQGHAEKLKLDSAPATPEEMGVQLAPVNPELVFKTSFRYVKNIMLGPTMMLVGLAWHPESVGNVADDMQGPLSIIDSLFVLSSDPTAFLFFLALLNAALAGMNIVPIPALDGARCLVVLWGAIRGRPVDPEKENRVHAVGLIVLLSLIVLKTGCEARMMYQGVHTVKTAPTSTPSPGL